MGQAGSGIRGMSVALQKGAHRNKKKHFQSSVVEDNASRYRSVLVVHLIMSMLS